MKLIPSKSRFLHAGRLAALLGLALAAPCLLAADDDSNFQIGVGANYWVAIEDAADESFDEDGLGWMISARYMATPVYVGVVGAWSVGEKQDENDDWTAAFTREEWTRALAESDYTYLYLLRVDDAFIERFGAAFPDKAGIVGGALFKIVRSGGAMTLTKVPVPTR